MLNVVIVDDDKNVLRCLEQMIPWQELGYRIQGKADNGENALRIIRQEMPQLVITDLKMPVMDGIALCQAIRKLSDDVEIIFFSAYEDFTTAKIALHFNVTDYLLKPIDAEKIQALRAILQSLFSNYRNRRFFDDLLTDSAGRKELLDHLSSGDGGWFQQFFEQFEQCSAGNFRSVELACKMLIDVVCDYLAGRGVCERAIEQKRADSLAALSALHTKAEMAESVCTMYQKILQCNQSPVQDSSAILYRQAAAYVEQNYASAELTVASLSQILHFSPDYISKAFIKYTGMAANAYITTYRLQRATERLQNTDQSINEIALECGYANLNYFIRTFKRHTGRTPKEYRMQVRLLRDEVSPHA